MNKKKLLKKAITQPIVMFLLGIATTLLLISSITPSVAETYPIIKNSELINDIAHLNTEIPKQTADERNKPSPSNFFNTHQIRVYPDRVQRLKRTTNNTKLSRRHTTRRYSFI